MSVLVKGMEMPIACSQCCLTGTCQLWLEVESIFDRHRDCPLVEVEKETMIEELRDFVNDEIHPLVSPDNYWAYSRLIDMIDEIDVDHRKEKIS